MIQYPCVLDTMNSYLRQEGGILKIIPPCVPESSVQVVLTKGAAGLIIVLSPMLGRCDDTKVPGEQKCCPFLNTGCGETAPAD